MLTLLTYLIFIISVALSAAGIILSSRLRNRYQSEIFSSLLYFQAFIYTFGFYGIWSQAAIRTFLPAFISPELIIRFSNIALLLGLPFLIFAWLMLMNFSSGLSGRKTGKWFIAAFLLLNFTVLVIIGYYITGSNKLNTSQVIKKYYIIMNLVHFFMASYLIHLPLKGRSPVSDTHRRIISASIFALMLVQVALLMFYSTQNWLAILFLLVFFLGNTFLPVYFSYFSAYPAFIPSPEKDITFEEFCRKYEVSPRESDIIREICNGLSNKEISKKLFISLQTVKDHTHRIYIKTNVRSRVQLINLVNEITGK